LLNVPLPSQPTFPQRCKLYQAVIGFIVESTDYRRSDSREQPFSAFWTQGKGQICSIATPVIDNREVEQTLGNENRIVEDVAASSPTS
jgi:hypothetical protein